MDGRPTPNAGTTQHAVHDEDRRVQERVPLQLRATRARRWVGGAWRDLEATLVDIGPRGVGLSLTGEVRLGDRVSLTVQLPDDVADLRVTVEIRHVRPGTGSGSWRAGGLFRGLPPADHARVMRFLRAA
jgi:hypothetical protein